MRTTNLAAAALTAAALVVTLTLARPGAAEDSAKPEYVGDQECQKCHLRPQHKSWQKTKMAKSFKTLQPTPETDKELFEKKKATGMDPAKDYTTDAKCLKCHTTGYGEPGGYPVEPAKDDAAKKAAKALASVSCEACHGPGSLYVKHKTEEQQKNKDVKFTWDELAKFGLTKPDENVCAKCHNKDAPSQPAEPFKFEDAKKKVHDHPAPK